MTTAQSPRRGANYAFLIAGYAIGQGSIFIAQTWLVGTQQFHFLALFGTHFTFAILASGVVDFGSLTTLARHAIRRSNPCELSRLYWATCVVRLSISLLVIGIGIAIAVISGEPFSLPFVLGGAPGLVLWAFNAGGVLDGRRQSGISGMASSLPYICSSLVLPSVATVSEVEAGWILGGAFSMGLGGSSLLTAWVAHRSGGLAMTRFRLNPHSVRAALSNGMAVLANWVPGQAFYRLQVVICAVALGPVTTALFLYGKQIVNALSQLVVFMRRVEFPNLVAEAVQAHQPLLRVTLRTLRVSLSSAFVVALAAASLHLWPSSGSDYDQAKSMVALLSPLVLSSSVYSTFAHGILAVGAYTSVAKVAWMAIIMGVALSLALIPWGIAGLVAAEVIAHVVGTALLLRGYLHVTRD